MAAVALVGGLVVLPVLRLGQVLWHETGGDLRAAAGSAGLVPAVRNTLVLAIAVPLAATPIGVAMALALCRTDLPGRSLWRVAVLVPLVVPDFVLGYSWTQAYARGGFTDTALGVSWAGLLGSVGVWLVLVVNAAPLVYLVVAAGLAARGDADAERAARASGAGSATTLVTVTLRLLLPAVAAASVLVLVLTLGTFAIPQVLGAPAGFGTVTTRIYADLSIGGDPDAFSEAVALALLLVVVTAVCVAPADALLRPRLRTVRAADPQTARPVPGRPAVLRTEAAVLGGYLALTTALPLAALALASVTRAVGVPPPPGNWDLDSYREVLTPRTAEALGRTVGLALVAAVLLVLLGGLVAVGERRRAGRATATLITLTLVLPGSTLAVGMLLTYGRWLSGTLVIILMAYLAKLWAFGHRPIAGALDRLPPDEVRAARSSGAGRLTAVRTVVLQALAPAVLGAFLLCFLTALHEVTMSSLLYGPGSETLAVIVLNSQELGRVGPTAALSILLTLLVAVPALLLWAAVGRRARAAAAPAGRLREVARAG
jgi:iron(III) transport system permease protein